MNSKFILLSNRVQLFFHGIKSINLNDISAKRIKMNFHQKIKTDAFLFRDAEKELFFFSVIKNILNLDSFSMNFIFEEYFCHSLFHMYRLVF